MLLIILCLWWVLNSISSNYKIKHFKCNKIWCNNLCNSILNIKDRIFSPRSHRCNINFNHLPHIRLKNSFNNFSNQFHSNMKNKRVMKIFSLSSHQLRLNLKNWRISINSNKSSHLNRYPKNSLSNRFNLSPSNLNQRNRNQLRRREKGERSKRKYFKDPQTTKSDLKNYYKLVMLNSMVSLSNLSKEKTIYWIKQRSWLKISQ